MFLAIAADRKDNLNPDAATRVADSPVVVKMVIARLLFAHNAATRAADSLVVVEMVIAAGGILIFFIAKPTIQKSHGSNTHNIGKTNICT